MATVLFDEGKNLKDCLPGEVFLFEMQGFIHMGELLLSENPNSKAQYYVEPGKQMLLKLSTMFELDPECEPYSVESVVHCLSQLREEERTFAVKMVLEFEQGIELTMIKNPIITNQRPNVIRNYQIINKMIEDVNEFSKNWPIRKGRR